MASPRKQRIEKKPFRPTKKIENFLINNPLASPEEVKEFRKIYKYKCDNIRNYCRKHPSANKQELIDSLPTSNIEELKEFKLYRHMKSNTSSDDE